MLGEQLWWLKLLAMNASACGVSRSPRTNRPDFPQRMRFFPYGFGAECSDKAWVYYGLCGYLLVQSCGWTGWSAIERAAIQSLEKAARRRSEQDLAVPTSEEEWRKELAGRCIGYGGEEISICHALIWGQIIPGLPPPEHGACVDTFKWVGPRTRHFLLNPHLLLKDQQDVMLPKMPGRIHMDSADKLRIAHELVKRQVALGFLWIRCIRLVQYLFSMVCLGSQSEQRWKTAGLFLDSS